MNAAALEQVLEASFVRTVRNIGGWAVKFVPVVKGLPDRLVFMPGGRIFLVELKRPNGGQVSPAQRLVHARLSTLGVSVAVLSSPEEIRAWVREIVQATDPRVGANNGNRAKAVAKARRTRRKRELREARAAGWDEGHSECPSCPRKNPYRDTEEG